MRWRPPKRTLPGGTVVTAPTCGSSGVVPGGALPPGHLRDFLRIRILRALATPDCSATSPKPTPRSRAPRSAVRARSAWRARMAAAAACQLSAAPFADRIRRRDGARTPPGPHGDPVCGLVQVPCIERNAIAAARALDANIYATLSDGHHLVSYDKVVEVMNETGHNLPSLYRGDLRGRTGQTLRPEQIIRQPLPQQKAGPFAGPARFSGRHSAEQPPRPKHSAPPPSNCPHSASQECAGGACWTYAR